MNPDEFYESLLPYAMSVTERTGLDPRLVLAQAALETGYGKSAPNYNFFGIKSHGRSGGQNLMTSEFEGGRMVQKPQSFRGYSDPSESFEDYASFLLENPRYGDVLAATDLESQIAAMGESGYATDPDYALKLSQIASRFPDAPQATPEAQRARYGLGDRGPGTTAQVLSAVRAGDMTKSEAARYVSEDLLEDVEGGSAFDMLNQDDEEEASLLDRLGEAAAYMDFAGVGQAQPIDTPSRLSTTIDPGARNAGSAALQRFGLESLVRPLV